MFKKFIHFIKYNNATIIILVAMFIISASAFATEPGREVVGQKQTSIEGIDNTLLIEADLAKMDMDFRIEKIETDDPGTSPGQGQAAESSLEHSVLTKASQGYYYITYTYIDLVKIDNAWQYQLQEKNRKISKKLKQDLGVYLAQELAEEYQARIKELREEQEQAQEQGEEKRVEVVEYSGLIGKALDLAGKVFPGYEPVKKKEISSPPSPIPALAGTPSPTSDVAGEGNNIVQSGADNLTEIYNDFINEHDPDQDDVFGADDNCPTIYNPEQLDNDNDDIGDECDLTPDGDVVDDSQAASTEEKFNETEEEKKEGSVEIIELPAEEVTTKEQPAEEEAVGSEEETPSEEDQETVTETEPISEEVVGPEPAPEPEPAEENVTE